MRRIKFCSLAILFAAPALAQTDGTYLLLSSNTVSPSSPTTTIEIWAAWDDPVALFYFSGGNYDLTAGDGEFSNPVNMLQGPGSTAGVATGNVISGGINGQLFFFTPLFLDNPILLASYEWTTTNFSPRSVSLDTSNTTDFIVALISTGVPTRLFPQEFTPGSGVINVVPAPAAWLAIALPLVAGRRRRW